MTKHRSHGAAFKRQVAEKFSAGETLHTLSQRRNVSRQLIRIWVGKFEAGALDDDVQAADLLQEYEANIAALERMVGRQALEIELLKGALKHAPRPREHARLGVAPQIDQQLRHEMKSIRENGGLASTSWTVNTTSARRSGRMR